MPGTVPNVGEVVIAKAAIGQTAAAAWTLRLFSNNKVPAAGDVIGDYTEVAGGGYAAFALTAATWTVVGGAPTSASYPHHAFVFTGATNAPGTVYGYYITDANNVLSAAERLPSAPYTPAVNGDTVDVTPVITFGSATND